MESAAMTGNSILLFNVSFLLGMGPSNPEGQCRGRPGGCGTKTEFEIELSPWFSHRAHVWCAVDGETF